ncbi:MAG: adenosylcobinamide-phosphate synthase CbiB [Nitrospira sp.]|nr:adenosylcobinamide-phosphate synthase CbiB [Nitrospira sp.]
MIPGDLLLASLLDALVGDPRWLPHPVRSMGRVVRGFERAIRPWCGKPGALHMAGVLLAVTLPSLTFVLAWTLIMTGTAVHDWLGRGLGIWLAFSTLAWRDLVDHVVSVSNPLKIRSWHEARTALSRIVGRDTDHLSESEIVRATVETVAESAADGIIAPLFYLILGGAPLALAYKAVSTLDSLVGHRDERYREFGWASARLDDLANWIPARITAVLIVIATALVFRRPAPVIRSIRTLWLDGRKHPSPNSGRPEASMAGALGIRLGGTNYYHGIPQERPFLGDAIEPLATVHIDQAKRVMTTAYLLGLAAAWGLLWR